MILLDTGDLLAALDGSQRRHAEAAVSLNAAHPPFLLSPKGGDRGVGEADAEVGVPLDHRASLANVFG